MSTRRLSAEVVGNASGFLAMMNRVQSSVTRFGNGLGTVNRTTQTSNRYLQAMSTTLRYAFAGRIIFGIQNAITNLGEFKTQLGEIDALAGRMGTNGQFQGLGGQLDDVGKQALLMSNRFGVAVTEVESYMQRFYTSFKPTGTAQQQAQEMERFVKAHLELVTMLGSRAGDPNALAGGLAGLIRAMPGGEKNAGASAQTLSNYFARIITSSPNLSGQDISSAAGRLASAKNLAGMSVRDVLASFGLAAETGGSSAVIVRGMTQLLGQSLLHPTRPASLRTYQAAGLPTDPNALHKLGGERVLEGLINFVTQTPAGSKQRALNLDAIYNAFSRQESVRQFVNMIANGGVPALHKFQKSLDDAAKSNYASKAAADRLKYSTLTRMRTASTNLGISLVSGADWPLEHLVADPIIGLSNLAAGHPKATQGVIGGALGLGAANALRRLGAFGRLGKRFGFLGAAAGIEQAAIGGAISKEELPSAISGGATDGSRANPFWVIISPLSWSLGGPAMTGGGGGGSGTGKSPFGFLKKVPKVIPIGLVGAAASEAAALLALPGDSESKSPAFRSRFTIRPTDPNRSLDQMGVPHADIGPLFKALTVAGLWDQFRHGTVQRVTFDGNPKADLTIKFVDSSGRTLMVQEHKGVPIIPKPKTFPTSQGKAGSRKGST